LFILWLFFSIASYFVVYKPISPELGAAMAAQPPLAFSAAALWRSLLDLLAALWIALLALGLGLPIWRWLGLEEQGSGGDAVSPLLPSLLFSWGLGFGALGLMVLAVGLMGRLRTAVLFPLAILLTLFMVWEIGRLEIRDWRLPNLQSLVFTDYIRLST